MDSPLSISNFPVSNIALIYFTLASQVVNKTVKARHGQQSKSEPWVEVLFCCLAICWTFSSARLLRYVQRQPGVISDRFYSSCSYSFDSTRPNSTSVIFLTHSVNVRRRRWYFWLALSFSTECKCIPCHSIGRLHHSRLFDQDLGFWISSIWKSKSINTERVEMFTCIQ